MSNPLDALLNPFSTRQNTQGTEERASNTEGTTSGHQTGFNQSNAWQGLNPLFQGWQGYTQQGPQGPNDYQTGAANTLSSISQSGVDPNRIHEYMSPYLSDVMRTQNDFANEQFGRDLSKQAGSDALQGNITGSGHRDAQALLRSQQRLGQNAQNADLLNRGYGQALTAANQDVQARQAGAQGAFGAGQTLWNNPQAWWQGQGNLINSFSNASGQNTAGTQDGTTTQAQRGWGYNQGTTQQQPPAAGLLGFLGGFLPGMGQQRAASGGRVESYAEGGPVRGYWGGGATMGGWPTGGGDPFIPQAAPQHPPTGTGFGFNPAWGPMFAQQFGGNPGLGGWGGGFGYGQPPMAPQGGFGGGQPRMPAWGQFQTQPAAQPMKPAMANPTAATGGLSPGLATAPQAAAVLGSMGGPGNWSYGASMAPSPAAQPAAAPQNAGATSTTGVLGAPMMAQPMAQPAAATGTGGPSSSLGGWSYGGGNSMQMGGFASGGSVSMADKVGHAFKAFHRMKHEAKNGFAYGGETDAGRFANPALAESGNDHFNEHIIDRGPLMGHLRNDVMDKAMFAAGAPWPTPQTTMPDQMSKPAMGPSPANSVSPFGATVHPGDWTTDTRPFASGGPDDPAHWDAIQKQAEQASGSGWPSLKQIGAKLGDISAKGPTGPSSGQAQDTGLSRVMGAQSESVAKILAGMSAPRTAADGGSIRHGYKDGDLVTWGDSSLPPAFPGSEDAPLSGATREIGMPYRPADDSASPSSTSVWDTVKSYLPKPTGMFTRNAEGVRNPSTSAQDLAAVFGSIGGEKSPLHAASQTMLALQGQRYDDLKAKLAADKWYSEMKGKMPGTDELTMAGELHAPALTVAKVKAREAEMQEKYNRAYREKWGEGDEPGAPPLGKAGAIPQASYAPPAPAQAAPRPSAAAAPGLPALPGTIVSGQSQPDYVTTPQAYAQLAKDRLYTTPERVTKGLPPIRKGEEPDAAAANAPLADTRGAGVAPPAAMPAPSQAGAPPLPVGSTPAAPPSPMGVTPPPRPPTQTTQDADQRAALAALMRDKQRLADMIRYNQPGADALEKRILETEKLGKYPLPGKGFVPLPGFAESDARAAALKKEEEDTGAHSAKYHDSLYKGLAGTAMIAAQQRPNIELLQAMINDPNFASGTLSNWQQTTRRALATAGINPDSAKPRETFDMVMGRVLADQFSGLKSMSAQAGEEGSRIFAPMLAIEEKALPHGDDSVEGIKQKVAILDHAGRLMMVWGDHANDYKTQYGKLDPNFDKWIRHEIAKTSVWAGVTKEEEMRAAQRLREAGLPQAPGATPSATSPRAAAPLTPEQIKQRAEAGETVVVRGVAHKLDPRDGRLYPVEAAGAAPATEDLRQRALLSPKKRSEQNRAARAAEAQKAPARAAEAAAMAQALQGNFERDIGSMAPLEFAQQYDAQRSALSTDQLRRLNEIIGTLQ